MKKTEYKIGKNYLIRTVTHIQVGRIVAVFEKELVIDKACWIADTGRFADALRDGIEKQISSEIEPFPEKSRVIVNRESIIDAVEYLPKLPFKQK